MAYCAGKETHHLKDLANAMLRKPESIDALAMFIRPTYWLSPIGTLLDQWRWDDIHGLLFGGYLADVDNCRRVSTFL